MGLLGARVASPGGRATCWCSKSFPFHLLVVLIGAAYLARARAEEFDRRMKRACARKFVDRPVGVSHYLGGGGRAICVWGACAGHEAHALGVLMGIELVLTART